MPEVSGWDIFKGMPPTFDITHTRTATLPASADPAQIQADDWNDTHTLVDGISGDLTVSSGVVTVTNLAAISGSVTSLSASVVSLSGSVISLSGQFTSLSSSFVSLSGSFSALSASFASLSGSVVSLGAQFTVVSASFASLSGSVVSLSASVVSLTASLVAEAALARNASNLSGGTVGAARMPGFSGDVSTSAGATVTAIGTNAVTNAMLAQAPSLTMKGNASGITANETDLTVSQILTMLGITAATLFYFGTGTDGSGTMDGTTTVNGMVPVANVYTALRTYHWTNLTVNSGSVFKPDGYPQYVNGNLSGSGLIDSSGFSGTLGSFGAAPFAVGRILPNGAAGGIAGLAAAGISATAIRYAIVGSAAGGTGAVTGSTGNVLQGGGGGGGAGGAGGAGGVVTLSNPNLGDWEVYEASTTGVYPGNTQSARAWFSVGSGGGGGGASGGTGSGGGGSAGYMVLFINAFTGAVIIRANGGAGSIGSTGGGFAGGGSGGGAGGIIVLVVGKSAVPPTPQVSGGIGGLASSGTGVSSNGGAGGPGKFIVFQ